MHGSLKLFAGEMIFIHSFILFP